MADERLQADAHLGPGETIPLSEPDWNLNTGAGNKALSYFVSCSLQGMTRGITKAMNYNKINYPGSHLNPALSICRFMEAFKI